MNGLATPSLVADLQMLGRNAPGYPKQAAILGRISLRSSLGHLWQMRIAPRLEWFSRIAPVFVELVALFELSSQRAPSSALGGQLLAFVHLV
jgi:hypothetical protein